MLQNSQMKISPNRCIIFVLAIMFSFLTIASSLVLFSISSGRTSTDVAVRPSVKAQVAANTRIDRNISQRLYPCLPKQAKELKLVAKVVSGKNSYHLVGIDESPSQAASIKQNYQETLVKLDDIGCSVVISKEQRELSPLSQYIPANIACNLEEQRYRRTIASFGGRKNYQEFLNNRKDEEFPDQPTYFFPEDVCALKKLGVQLPKNSRVINNFDEFLSDTKHEKSK